MRDLTRTNTPAAIAAQIAAVASATVSPLPVRVAVATGRASATCTRVPHATQNAAPGWSAAPHSSQEIIRPG